jgi:hypothetical protein
MGSDLNSIFKRYLSNLGKNEEAVVELTRNLRNWVVSNGEVVKERIETQIDDTVVKMGFVKNSELETLNARIAELESRIQSASVGSKKTTRVKKEAKTQKKEVGVKSPAVKKKNSSKKTVTKKRTAK